MKCNTCQQPMVRVTVKRDREVWLCQHCNTRDTRTKQLPVDPRRSKPI